VALGSPFFSVGNLARSAVGAFWRLTRQRARESAHRQAADNRLLVQASASNVVVAFVFVGAMLCGTLSVPLML
jgi:hypothetical protein